MNASKRQIQYAPQVGPYKVFVKDKGAWQTHDVARLQISVGNPKHDGEKFYALAEWAAARFDSIILIVSDTLQRHNLVLNMGLDDQQAHNVSLQQGDYWLSQNRAALDLMPQKTITKWNDWLNHADFNEAHALLLKLYDEHDGVKKAIQEKAALFSEKRIANLTNSFSAETITETSVRYIIEELSAFSLMFRGQRAIDVYPGAWFKDIFDVLKTVETPLLSGFNKADCLRVDFVKNPASPYMSHEKAA